MFSYLAAELRSGDIAVAGSDSYANLHDQLMSREECAPLIETFCTEAGLLTEARELTAHYKKLLADTRHIRGKVSAAELAPGREQARHQREDRQSVRHGDQRVQSARHRLGVG
ncbi:hypothetical protein [Nonomuraea angiospora]